MDLVQIIALAVALAGLVNACVAASREVRAWRRPPRAW